MRRETVDVYADDSNYAVVSTPGRKYPGCVIQGDSLRILLGLAQDLVQHVQSGLPLDEQFLGSLQELHNNLLERLLHYQEVLQRNSIELPYSKPAMASDTAALIQDE